MSRWRQSRRVVSLITALAVAATLPGTAARAASSGSASKHASTQTKQTKAATDVLTQDRALARAHSTGKPVAVPGDETATSSLTANPNDTFTLTTYALPVRKNVDGTWHPLDATLVKNPDGSISPALSASPLTLSGGGSAPLVTMHSGIHRMALTLPTSLPVPSLSGNTATYANVIPGVDLVVTVTDQGGFSDVYVVHSAAAAANPKLSTLLTSAVDAPGLTLSVDAAGNIHAADPRGQSVFNAPSPSMWDSATTAVPAHVAQRAANSVPATASSTFAPGSRAHSARLGEKLTGNVLHLSADASLLTGTSAAYPEYVDPAWASYYNGQWATVSENFPGQSYWNTSAESEKLMQVGMSTSGFWADSLINFNIPTGEIYNGGTPKIETAYFYATNHATNNHTTSSSYLYAPSATLNQNNATWNSWFTSSRNLGSAIASTSFSQDNSNSVGFQITNTNWLSASKSVQTFALAGDSYSDESSNTSLYKVFYNPLASSGTNAPSLALTFTHPPTVFDLSTSPNKTVIGDGSVSLNADVYDVDGGTLNATFNAYITGHTNEVVKTATLSVGSGNAANMWIYQPTLDADIVSSSFGNTSTTTSMSISWQVTVSNNNGQSATSGVKTFTYSTAVPGAPNVWTDNTDQTGCPGPGPYTVGTPATFYLTPEANDSTKPTTFIYQLNAGQPITVNATTTSPGKAISIIPTGQLNILTVVAVAASGNIGQPTLCKISAGSAPNATSGNMTGGSDPDLMVTGTGSAGLPAGLWVAPGTSNGQVNGNTVNIGINGTGASVTNTSATTYTGTDAVNGLFQGQGFNDVLDYNPTTQSSNEACSAQLIYALGNGLALNPDWGENVNSNDFTLNSGTTSAVCATSIANGGNLNVAETNASSSPVTAVNPATYNDSSIPDLLMVANGSLYLNPTTHAPGAYTALSNAIDLADTNPTGSGSWSGWTITSFNTGGDIPYMFAVNQSTGAVYYYSTTQLATLVWDAVQGNSTAVTPVALATSGYSTANYAQIEATSIDSSATPALWAVTSAGKVSTFEINSAGTGLTQTGSTTTLGSTSHSWALNDNTTSSVTAADSSASGLALKGTGSVAYTSGDVFSPDLEFTTGVNGTAYTTGKGLTLTSSFTVSVWAEPETMGTMVVSQDGVSYPGLMLYPTPSGWQFYLAKDDGTAAWGGDSITGGTVQLGAWAHVQASYDAGTKVMSLYVDNTFVATGSHTAPGTGASGDLRLGANIDNKAITSYFTGQIAQLQTWAGQPLAPSQAYTPAGYHQAITPERILDTRKTATNAYSGYVENNTPLGADGTLTLPIVGDTVTPNSAGAPTTIPSTATAVAIDVTVTSQTSNGNIITYADGAERPITSSTNYTTGYNATGYQIVPLGQDGKIALFNGSTGTTQLIVDITGYFTSDATLAGDQTYHPITASDHAVNTGLSLANTNLTGTTPLAVPAGKAFTMNITGVDGIPTNATGVAVNFTTLYEAASGFLEVYPTGSTPSEDTTLSYQTSYLTSMSADVPLGTGGTITIVPEDAATRVIADISGYYTTDTSGQAYHTVNPTRLVDTRNDIGGSSGPIAATSGYTVSAADTQQITTAANPTLALMVTETDATGGGTFTVYPDGATRPNAFSLSWISGQAFANLALAPEGSDGAIDIYNTGNYTTQLVVDTSGYYANDAAYAPAHGWALTDGTGTTAKDGVSTVSPLPLTLNGTTTWTTANVGSHTKEGVLNLDGSTGYGTTSGPALNTAGGFSVSAWANLSTIPGGNATIVAQSGTQAAGFYLQYTNYFKGWCMIFMTSDVASAGGYTTQACTSTAPTAATWYHLVGTYDPASHTAAIYVNGTLAGTATGITNWSATGNLTVGGAQYNAVITDHFPGDISNIETFNYPLTSAQVGDLYQKTS